MVAFWNDWFTALIYMNDKSKYPLQLVLRQILIQSQASANGACGIEPSCGHCRYHGSWGYLWRQCPEPFADAE